MSFRPSIDDYAKALDKLAAMTDERDDWERRHKNAVDMLHASEEERAALKSEVERLKADKARLDWLEKNGEDLMTTNGKWVVMSGRCMTATETSVREAIDAALKGDA